MRRRIRIREQVLAEVRGIIRDYVRMRNIKRVTVIELGQLITPSPGKSTNRRRKKGGGYNLVHFTPKGYSLAAADTRRGRRRRRTSPEAGLAGGSKATQTGPV